MDKHKEKVKPLILLYKTPLGFYFYETNRNEIVSVNEQLFKYIETTMNDKETESYKVDEEIVLQYDNLKECGYLSTNRVKEVKHPATDNLELFLDRKIDSITLQVTQSCNLRCSYCVYSEKEYKSQRNHSNKMMSFETAKKAVDFFFLHSIDTRQPNISFYGGEPFLNLELIKQMVVYAKKIFEGRKVTFTTTTNATLLTDELMDYLAENNFNLMISLDGPKVIHDQNRTFASNGKGTYDTVVKNIERLWERHPEYAKTVSTSMVINPLNSYDVINSLFDNKYIRKMRCSHSIVEKDNEIVRYSEQYIDANIYNQFMELLSNSKLIESNKVKRLAIDENEIMSSEISKIKYGMIGDVAAPGGPCNPGKMRLFIDYKGEFFPCERVNETSECMNLGSLEAGFNINNMKALLNIGKLTEDECINCWSFPQCTICGKKADRKGILSAEEKRRRCNESKEFVLDKIKNKILLFEINKHLSST